MIGYEVGKFSQKRMLVFLVTFYVKYWLSIFILCLWVFPMIHIQAFLDYLAIYAGPLFNQPNRDLLDWGRYICIQQDLTNGIVILII